MRAENLLTWLGQHSNYELSHNYDPYGEEWDFWQVHSVNGGVNDREWTRIGRGATPLEALQDAYDRT